MPDPEQARPQDVIIYQGVGQTVYADGRVEDAPRWAEDYPGVEPEPAIIYRGGGQTVYADGRVVNREVPGEVVKAAPPEPVAMVRPQGEGELEGPEPARLVVAPPPAVIFHDGDLTVYSDGRVVSGTGLPAGRVPASEQVIYRGGGQVVYADGRVVSEATTLDSPRAFGAVVEGGK